MSMHMSQKGHTEAPYSDQTELSVTVSAAPATSTTQPCVSQVCRVCAAGSSRGMWKVESVEMNHPARGARAALPGGRG